MSVADEVGLRIPRDGDPLVSLDLLLRANGASEVSEEEDTGDRARSS